MKRLLLIDDGWFYEQPFVPVEVTETQGLAKTHLEGRNMDHLVVLVSSDNGDDSRPAGTHVISAVQHLTGPHINIRVWLKPPCQPATASGTSTRNKVTQEQPLIGMATVEEIYAVEQSSKILA